MSFYTRQKVLCRVLFRTLDKDFAECQKALSKLRIKKNRQKEFLRRMFSFTKGFLRDTRQRASAKKTLGKIFDTRQRAKF
jgi:hypothetical protein